ncbi:hypothetical protein HG530_002112 [Fusarium avenaceum]|nr:hypothetical protein HG530_002112 [Fusarium avenaceum]
MQFRLDQWTQGASRATGIACVASLDRNVLTGENSDCQVHSMAWRGFTLGLCRLVGALVTLRFQDPTFLVCKHALVKHHAFVEILPIHGHHLDAATPKETRVWVRAIEPPAGGKGTHEISFVMGKHVAMLLLVQFEDAILTDREDSGTSIIEWLINKHFAPFFLHDFDHDLLLVLVGMYLQADNNGKIIINKCRLADGPANLSETTWRVICERFGKILFSQLIDSALVLALDISQEFGKLGFGESGLGTSQVIVRTVKGFVHLSGDMNVGYIDIRDWRVLSRVLAGAFIGRRSFLCRRLLPAVHGSRRSGGCEANHAFEGTDCLDVGVAKDGHGVRAPGLVVLCAAAPLDLHVSVCNKEISNAYITHDETAEERHGDKLSFKKRIEA